MSAGTSGGRRVRALAGTSIAPGVVVLLTRCAWHRKYYGYTIVVGVASWRGWKMGLSDGICRRCAGRVRAAWLDERRGGARRRTVQRSAQRCPPGSPGERDDREKRLAA